MNFLKRGIASVLFMTLALWLISWAMIENGSANPRNPSWVFVKDLKNIFSAVSAIGFGLSAVIFVAVHLPSIESSNHSEPQPTVRSAEEIKQEREAEKIRREQAAALAEEKKRMELETQNRQYEERKKQEELRKKSRSADAANREAFDYGGAIPSIKAFILGGRSTIRGFESGETLPRLTDDAIKNGIFGPYTAFYLVKSEIRFPITGSFGGSIFYDGGRIDLPGFSQKFPWRDSVGLGINIKTPVGPVSLEYGRKLNRDVSRGEGEQAVHFSIGVF